MSEITIPPEAVEAAAFHLPGYHSRDLWPHVEAAIRAALAAWPGAEYVFRQPHRRAVSYSKPAIILPLPQKEE